MTIETDNWPSAVGLLGEAINRRLGTEFWEKVIYVRDLGEPLAKWFDDRGKGHPLMPEESATGEKSYHPLLRLFKELADPEGALVVEAFLWSAQGIENATSAIPHAFWRSRGKLVITCDQLDLAGPNHSDPWLRYLDPRLALRVAPKASGPDRPRRKESGQRKMLATLDQLVADGKVPRGVILKEQYQLVMQELGPACENDRGFTYNNFLLAINSR
jgi:hypothetical protein